MFFMLQFLVICLCLFAGLYSLTGTGTAWKFFAFLFAIVAMAGAYWAPFLPMVWAVPAFAALFCSAGARMRKQREQRAALEDLLRCPYCAEVVQPQAIICPHCRSDIRERFLQT